jgi:hypothetical protein
MQPAGGFGEEGLGNSSLDRARRGLPPEEGGILGDVALRLRQHRRRARRARRPQSRNVEWLQDNRNAKVELEGHADSRGTIEYNLALGAKRAKSVKDHLVGQGMRPTALPRSATARSCHSARRRRTRAGDAIAASTS